MRFDDENIQVERIPALRAFPPCRMRAACRAGRIRPRFDPGLSLPRVVNQVRDRRFAEFYPLAVDHGGDEAIVALAVHRVGAQGIERFERLPAISAW